MWVRRSLVTGVLAATLVVGGAGVAVARDGSGGAHGAGACARVASGGSGLQHKIAKLEQRIQGASDRGSGRHGRKLENLQARKAKAEQKLASLQAGCKS